MDGGGGRGAALTQGTRPTHERQSKNGLRRRHVRHEGGGGYGGADAQLILSRCPGCYGFSGASSMERLPVETALVGQVEAFKALRRDG